MNVSADLFDARNYAKVRLPPTEALALPHWAYTAPAWYEREIERIFLKTWNYVAHRSQLAKPGDFLTREIAGVPVVLTHGQDGAIRAFYNSCRHRGSRIAWGEGNCNALRCPYHSWTYTLEGRLVATPQVEDDHLKKSELGLHPVRLEEADGFLFVNFDAAAGPLDRHLGGVRKEWAAYDPANLICTRRRVYDVKANWKLYFENFNDSLHVPFIHQDSLAKQKVTGRQRASHAETDASYIAHFTQHKGSRGLLEDDQGQGLPRFQGLSGRYLEGTYYPCLYPATLFGFTVDCAWAFELIPRGPARTEVAAVSFFKREDVARPDFERMAQNYYKRMDTIAPEDNAAVERQQEGLSLPIGVSGRFTSLETLCHAFDNWVLDQVVSR